MDSWPICVLYSSIHVKEIIDISWLNGQNRNTSVKVLEPRFIKVKSIISDIKWCWWHLEILLLISNWLVSHRSPTAVLSNTFQTPEAPSRLCWPQSHLIWAYLHSNSATKRQFHGPSSPSLHRDRRPFSLLKTKTSCTFRFLLVIDAFLWNLTGQDF